MADSLAGWLAQRIGMDAAELGGSLIARGLRARMSALGLVDEGEYARVVAGSQEEVQALIDEVVVSESWFFRDELPFAHLQEYARAGWLADHARAPLRVLCLPCAEGEEPYSVSMALHDIGLPPARFQIDAVDISAQALARARRGFFGANSFRVADTGFRDRYFEPRPGGYQLAPSVVKSVRLVRGNVLDPDLLADQAPYDVIFCRNLLIYFDGAARERALATLDRLLGTPGLLFVGHAERLKLWESKFVPAGVSGSFAYRRAPEEPPAPDQLAPAVPRTTSGRDAPRPPRALSPPSRRVTAPPSVPVAKARHALGDGARPVASPPAPGLLEQAASCADAGRHDQAARLCESFLRESGPDARAFFLLGMIRQAAGDLEGAETFFQKTVYLDPQHDESLLALALIAQRRGDEGSAAGYRRRAERAHQRKGLA